MTTDPLSRFEDGVQRLIEGNLARLFAGQLHEREVTAQLVRCMEDQAVTDGSGRRIAPDTYSIRLNPNDHASILHKRPQLAQLLAEELLAAAPLAGLFVASVPDVSFLADPEIAPHQVRVSARHTGRQHESTESLRIDAVWEVNQAEIPNARLVLDGSRVVPVERPILNLGRHRDNDIVLDDRAVSRHHAQIRLRFGHYTLFDLGSQAGTTLNEQLVREAILRSGDVIQIGSQSIIFIEETPPDLAASADDTRPMHGSQHED